jgi:integrase/recombinase XerD
VTLLNHDLKFTSYNAVKGMIRKRKTDKYKEDWLVFRSERSSKLVKKWPRLKPKELQPVCCAINHGQLKDHAISDSNRKRHDLLIKGHNLAVSMRAED